MNRVVTSVVPDDRNVLIPQCPIDLTACALLEVFNFPWEEAITDPWEDQTGAETGVKAGERGMWRSGTATDTCGQVPNTSSF